MKKTIKILLISITALLLWSCSSTETIIKDKKIEFTVPAIRDSLPIVYKEISKTIIDSLETIFNQLPDSARIEAVRPDNPKIKIMYYPKKKFFELDVSAQKVDTTITDTTKNVIKKETTTAEKFGYALYGIIFFIALAVGVLAYLAIKFRWFN